MDKVQIGKAIKHAMIIKEKSLRGLASEIGISYPGVHRIASGKGYNIDNLLIVLDGLGLEIVIREKQ